MCPTEIISFSDKANEFHDINCEVVGVSVDSHFTHLAWINTPRKVTCLTELKEHEGNIGCQSAWSLWNLCDWVKVLLIMYL